MTIERRSESLENYSFEWDQMKRVGQKFEGDHHIRAVSFPDAAERAAARILDFHADDDDFRVERPIVVHIYYGKPQNIPFRDPQIFTVRVEEIIRFSARRVT